MEKIEIRPRFERKVTCTQADIIERFRLALAKEDVPVKGTLADHYIYLKIPPQDQHYWSPQLTLNVEEELDGSCSVHGLFGPRSSVWMMYIFFYTILAFAALFISITGFSQMNLGLSYRILWLLPVLLILFGFAYGTARAGQKLGHDEMHLLYAFFEETMKDNDCVVIMKDSKEY